MRAGVCKYAGLYYYMSMDTDVDVSTRAHLQRRDERTRAALGITADASVGQADCFTTAPTKRLGLRLGARL